MKGYLLDTNICIFAFRDQFGVIERMRQSGEGNCYVSDITVMELRYGAYKSARTEENLTLVNTFLKKVKLVSLSKTIDTFCLEKIRLERIGKRNSLLSQTG